MESIIIRLGYIHPHTKEWHQKAFTDIVKAREALSALRQHNISVMYADFRGNEPKVGFVGGSEDELIESFIRGAASEYTINSWEGDDYLVAQICANIQRRCGMNDEIEINGHPYVVDGCGDVEVDGPGNTVYNFVQIGTNDKHKLNAWIFTFDWYN